MHFKQLTSWSESDFYWMYLVTSPQVHTEEYSTTKSIWTENTEAKLND